MTTIEKFKKYKEKLNNAVAKKITLFSQIKEKKKIVKELKVKEEKLIIARELIRKASSITQERMKSTIENIVTSSLQFVPFERDYSFVMDFIARRNTMECDLLFKRGDNLIAPLESSGYGAADIASFSLRVGYNQLNEHSANVIIVDEPFSNLDKDKHVFALQMMKELHKQFGIQFIISSHEVSLINGADKVIEVSMDRKGVSHIR